MAKNAYILVNNVWEPIGGENGASQIPPFTITGNLAPMVGTLRWYNDTGMVIPFNKVRATFGSVPVDGGLYFRVLINGSVEFVSWAGPTATPEWFNGVIHNGDYLTIDIESIHDAPGNPPNTLMIQLSYDPESGPGG